MKRKIAKWLHKTLSTKNDGIPGTEPYLQFGELDDGKPMFTAATYNNDGFELWIAYTRGGWLVHFWQEEARRLAWFILWDWWVVSTWCGLKRRLYYWANREMLKRYRKPANA